MAERFTAKQVMELLSDDSDGSKGKESDFGDDELYSTLLDLVQMIWTFQRQG